MITDSQYQIMITPREKGTKCVKASASHMKILSWNIEGFGDYSKRGTIKDFIEEIYLEVALL